MTLAGSLQSVRFRTTAGATLVVAAALLAGTVGVTIAQERALRANVDSGLEQRADDLALLIEQGRLPEVLGAGITDESVAQVVTAGGVVVAASANIGGQPPLADFDPGDERVLRTLDALPLDDDPFRVLGERFETDQGTVTLYLGTSLDPTLESVAALRQILLLATPLMMLVVGGVTWHFVGRALAPVEAIRQEVATIGDGALDRRVPVPGADDEVRRLATTMNEMLARLEAAHRRQQEFVADASHELRSPLTSIRAQIEADLQYPHTADPLATERSVLDETGRLEDLVSDLLQLARGEAGVAPARHPLDLDDIVLDEVSRLRGRTETTFDISAVTGAQLLGDPEELRRLVRNLLENAARHARTSVRVELDEDGARRELRFAVSDDGPGVPPDQRDRIFERFARLDAGRARQQGGTGLGLAIVREIARRHRGTVVVQAPDEGGARFVVTLPLEGPPPSEA